MPTPAHTDRAALARERLAARARRASNLRRRVVAGALASFALAWGVIAFNGPMGQATTTASTQAATSATTSSSAATSTTNESTTTDDSSSSNDAAVTTAQS
jgi:cytoskeletal protein RodZ